MFIVKKIVIATLLGFIGYEAIKLIDGGFVLPAKTDELSILLILIATALAASLVGQLSLPRRTSRPARSSASSNSANADGREDGTVKWFNVRKGYGFITRDAGDDIFVHFRNIEGKGRRVINEGERVSFYVTDGDKGLQADEVIPI